MKNYNRDELLNIIESKFRTFGGNDIKESSKWNPISAAMKGKPLQFAAGVDVNDVIDTIEEYIKT